jgi:hypothetical protein
MGLKLKSLQKMGSAKAPDAVRDDDVVLVVVKLAAGARVPDYLDIRDKFGPDIVSAKVAGRDLRRLGEDPAVLSFQRSEQMPIIR